MKTVKKPTKAHKNKKVIKAHEGMAHVPRQSPANKGMGSPKNMSTNDPSHPQYRPPAPAFARDAMRIADLIKKKAQDKLRTRGPIAPRPQRPRTQIEPAVVQQPIKRRRPPRISDGPLDGGGRGTITPRKLTSREKRRRDNAFKSEFALIVALPVK